MGFFSPLKALGGALTGKASPIGMARSVVRGLPGPLHKSSSSPASSPMSTMATKAIPPESTVPQFTPAPQADWKSFNPYGEDQSYGTGLDQPLGTRLSGGDWSNY